MWSASSEHSIWCSIFWQSTTEEAAKDIAAFVAIFFAHFSKFEGRGLHLSGESYAVRSVLEIDHKYGRQIYITQGRYLPVFASAIYDQNPLLVEAGLHPINLTSVIIGNGFTDWPTMMSSMCAL